VIRARQFLPIVLFIAVAVRLWGLGFGLPYIMARPDEAEIGGAAVGFLSGDLRPPAFQWPTLFPYITAAIYVVYFVLTQPFTGYATLGAFAESRYQSVAPFLYITRSLSAVMGVMTVWWVYAICRRLFDDAIAIVAALFLALAFLHVRDSHFGVTDVAMTGLVVLTMLAILKWRQTGNVLHAAAAGLAAGLAASTKYNGFGVSVPFVVALGQRVVEDRRARTATDARRRLVQGLLAFGAALAIGFFGASPYILIDWSRFVNDVSGVGMHLAGGHGMILGRGWSYYARVVLPAAIGWPMFAAGAAGVLILLITRLRDAAILFAFPVAYYLVAGRGYTVFARYIIPVLPFLCIAAAWLVVTGVRVVARRATPAVRGALVAAAAIAVVAPTARKALLLDRLLATTDNRVIVARALVETLPPNSVMYQSGETYGYVPMAIDGRDVARVSAYNDGSGKFDSGVPDWILVQRSPLVLYSAVPLGLERLLHERYVLVRRFPTEEDRSDRIYDQQDAFYLPLNGLEGITRPGPAFELYRNDPRRH
jgi:hypothetical protein